MNFQSNPQLEIAFDYVRYTNKNIFLTGKAGTGKTTFLHRIKNELPKRLAIVAPTGVAAINAGGVTIHSFFQLPFGPYLPDSTPDPTRQRKFVRDKIRLIQSLDLLVIDEISMVRADLLDGIDDVLRRYREPFKPFGGVQLLMIGDLHQLPPVVKEEEWDLLRSHYQTAYFFGSKALQKTQPVAIELKHIYRQADATFIDLLNKVRDNKIDADVLEKLNSRYLPDFQPSESEPYITLSSHNASAAAINQSKLAEIKTPMLQYKAKIDGDFPAYSFPTEETLEFKTNAQVMFVKNDISKEKLYYNGKIGKITKIENDVVYVQCPDDAFEIAVSPAEWRNVKYTLNESTKEIEEDIIGTFTQYPLKLAWAITIHKSQGLTFERAIIDANAAFAHGQVYVALSRCKSFEGIVLHSKIANSSVKTDTVVRNYSEDVDRNAPNEEQLKQSKIEFQQSLIIELFDFKMMKKNGDYVKRLLLENENIINKDALTTFQEVYEKAEKDIFEIAAKFSPQMQTYFVQYDIPEENEQLIERIKKAGVYFEQKLKYDFFADVKKIGIVTDNKAVLKSISEAIEVLLKTIFSKNACFVAAQKGFNTNDYLRAKANSELDFQNAQREVSATPSSIYTPKDIKYPALYAILKKWRDDKAADNGVETYMVFPSKALLDLVESLPTNANELATIKGIGAVKIKQFGAEIIDIIQSFCEENNIAKTQMTLASPKPAKPEKAPKVESKLLSFELYKAGKTIEEIAAERGFVATTIEGHLAHFVGTGELDITTFMEQSEVDEIIAFFIDKETKLSSEAKVFFGEKYSYPQIKMALAFMQRNM